MTTRAILRRIRRRARHRATAKRRDARSGSLSEILRQTAHRPYPLPAGPWMMSHHWHDLVFMHWPVDAAALAPHVPPPLEIDRFDAQAWVGLVAFRMSRIRFHGLPPLPYLHCFAELNVRTYVRLGDRRGVLFLTLDAPRRIPNAVARRWFHLPYRLARIHFARGDSSLRFQCRRIEPDAPAACLDIECRPEGRVYHSAPASLEHWLTERYCLFAPVSSGRLYTADIHHIPWPLERAVATVHCNTMTHGLGVPLNGPPAEVHYARWIRALVWPPRRQTVASRRASQGRPSAGRLLPPTSVGGRRRHTAHQPGFSRLALSRN